MFLTILVFVLILGLLIFVHEWGHFLAARAAGIKVDEFAFGFPPRLISWKRGETRYAVNALPIGGYVKLLGEDGGSSDPRSFSKQPVGRRLGVVVAGVAMNFVLASVVLWIGFMVGMVPVVSDPASLGGSQSPQLMIVGVEDQSPAAGAAIEAGDRLIDYSRPEELQAFTRSHAGETVTLKIERKSEQLVKTVTLRAEGEAPLGVELRQITQVKLGVWGAARAAVTETGKTIAVTFDFLGRFFKQLFTTGKVAEGVSGPVGIFQVTGQAVNLGFSYVLQLIAILSVNLGLLNILPFPALDGGRAFFIVLEGVVRRKVVREEIEGIIHAVGFILLLILVVLITYRDILHLR